MGCSGTISAISFVLLFCNIQGEEISTLNDSERDPKLSVFQVVKFSNSICAGSSRNGTCYTAAECSNIGGSKDGTCADGFGVCCIVILGTSGSSSVNNTYIYKASSTTFTAGDHKYTICPCSSNICRIRFDFTTFQIASPNTGYGTVFAGANAAGYPIGTAQAIGDCYSDTFYVNAPYGRSTPVICGLNTAQHMYVETADSECVDVHYGVGGGSSSTRELDIRVSQFTCGDEMGGPPGCLQYYTSSAGKIRSFNFPDLSMQATVGYKYVHLSRQHYKACVRQNSGKKYICYWPCTAIKGVAEAAAGEPVTNQPSFGLSPSPNAAGKSAISSSCTSDYISIPMGMVSTIAAILTTTKYPTTAASTITRYCGRYFGTSETIYIATSVCSLSVPFELNVDFNDDELCTANTSAVTCEFQASNVADTMGSGGILGFNMCFQQIDA